MYLRIPSVRTDNVSENSPTPTLFKPAKRTAYDVYCLRGEITKGPGKKTPTHTNQQQAPDIYHLLSLYIYVKLRLRLSLLSLRKRNTAVINFTAKCCCTVPEYSNLTQSLVEKSMLYLQQERWSLAIVLLHFPSTAKQSLWSLFLHLLAEFWVTGGLRLGQGRFLHSEACLGVLRAKKKQTSVKHNSAVFEPGI